MENHPKPIQSNAIQSKPRGKLSALKGRLWSFGALPSMPKAQLPRPDGSGDADLRGRRGVPIAYGLPRQELLCELGWLTGSGVNKAFERTYPGL